MSSNSTADNYILTRQIKLTIQKYYVNLNQNQLAQKVRTQIIPLLITLFFQTDVKSSKKLLGSTKQLVNSLNNLLQEKENINGIVGDGKNNINVSIGNGKYKKLYNQAQLVGEDKKQYIKDMKINQFMNNNASVQDLIYRTLALCKLANSIENLRKKRQNQQQIFIIYKQSKAKKIKSIKWLQKYVSFTQRRQILSKFYQNYQAKKRQIQTCRALHKLYIIKINNYYTIFKHNIVNNHLQSQQYQTKRWQQYKNTMYQRGISKLDKLYQKNLWKALNKIKLYNFMGNQWRIKWVRNIVFKTPANLQTSLWRLKNFVKNQQLKQLQRIEKQKQQIKKQALNMLQVSSFQVQTQPLNIQTYNYQQQSQHQNYLQSSLVISKIVKKNPNNIFIPPILQKSFNKQSKQESTKKILQAVQSATDKSQLQAILFTSQQKAQIFTQQLQYIYKLMSMENLIYAFSQIDLYVPQKQGKKCENTQEKQNIDKQNIEQHKQIIHDALRTSILQVQGNLLKNLQKQFIKNKQQQNNLVKNIVAESIKQIQQNFSVNLQQYQEKQQKSLVKNAINESLKTIQVQLIKKQQKNQNQFIQNTIAESIKNIQQEIIDRNEQQQQQQEKVIANTINESLKNIGFQIAFQQQNQQNFVVNTIVSQNLMAIGESCSNKIIGSDMIIDQPIQDVQQSDIKKQEPRVQKNENSEEERKQSEENKQLINHQVKDINENQEE